MVCFAQNTVVVRWDAVTERENGDKLKEGELLFYQIEHVNQELEVINTYQVKPDVHTLELIIDNDCGYFQAFAAAEPGPSDSEEEYLLSKPSELAMTADCPERIVRRPSPPELFQFGN